MSEKKSGFVYFEGIIPEKKDKKDELAITDAAYLIAFEIPKELTNTMDWIPKSQVKEIKREGDCIRGKVARWLLEKKFNFEMLEVESAQSEVESAQSEVESAQSEVEVIHPAVETKRAEDFYFEKEFTKENPLTEILHALMDIQTLLMNMASMIKEKLNFILKQLEGK